MKDDPAAEPINEADQILELLEAIKKRTPPSSQDPNVAIKEVGETAKINVLLQVQNFLLQDAIKVRTRLVALEEQEEKDRSPDYGKTLKVQLVLDQYIASCLIRVNDMLKELDDTIQDIKEAL